MYFVDWDSSEFGHLNVDEKVEILAFLNASSLVASGDGILVKEAGETGGGSPFVIPLLIPEGLESGDGRSMEENALDMRDLPIPLLWQPSTGDGHNGSYIVGRIDSLERVDGGLGNARGVFDTGPYGREAERLVRERMLRGVSADLDKFEAKVAEPDPELDVDPNKITNEKMKVSSARVMAATLVAKPAFQECTIELVSEDNMPEEPMVDGIYEEQPPANLTTEYALSTLIASAAPVNPPSAWFTDPELTGPTPLTVTDDGKVFGHIATWDTDHVGFSHGVKPPRSRSNYAYFRTGLIKTIEGEDVAVGQLTLLGGHAPLDASAQMAVKHYDDTASAVADVTAGEDQFGIWVSGGLRPDVTPEQVRVFRASAPSGDWRPINGVLELVAVCQVNVPGFPVARARVASGSVMALVAAGTATLNRIRQSEHDALANRVSAVEQQLLAQRKAELAANFAPVREARINRLREAAAQARSAFAPELDKRAQAQAELAAGAEAARARFNEFKLSVVPDFKEELHPRDEDGKFRKILAKLSEVLDGPDASPEAHEAKSALERAADLEEQGDSEGAKAAGKEAQSKLESAADKADAPEDETKLHDAAEKIDGAAPVGEEDGDKSEIEASEPKDDENPVGDVAKKVADKVEDAGKDIAKGDAPADDDIPDEIKQLMEKIIDEIGEGVDPKSILSRMDSRLKQWLEGKGFESPEDMIRFIEDKLQKPVQPGIAQ